MGGVTSTAITPPVLRLQVCRDMLVVFFLIGVGCLKGHDLVLCQLVLTPTPKPRLDWGGKHPVPECLSRAQQFLRPGSHFAPSTAHLMLASGHSAPFPSKQPASPFKRVIRSQPGGQGRISVLGPPRRWEGGQMVELSEALPWRGWHSPDGLGLELLVGQLRQQLFAQNRQVMGRSGADAG